MVNKPNKLDTLKLQVAKPVDTPPPIGRGSSIDGLPEYEDVMAIIKAIREGADPSGRTWEISDEKRLIKAARKLRIASLTMAAFAIKVRRFLLKHGVARYVRVEQRKDKLYLVGIEQPQER